VAPAKFEDEKNWLDSMRKMWLSVRMYFGDLRKILELGKMDFGGYGVRSSG